MHGATFAYLQGCERRGFAMYFENMFEANVAHVYICRKAKLRHFEFMQVANFAHAYI
jgi:hypothetical protein